MPPTSQLLLIMTKAYRMKLICNGHKQAEWLNDTLALIHGFLNTFTLIRVRFINIDWLELSHGQIITSILFYVM